jgi:hypothetical protein
LEDVSRLPRTDDAEQYPICFCAMFVLQMSYYVLVWRKRRVQRLI